MKRIVLIFMCTLLLLSGCTTQNPSVQQTQDTKPSQSAQPNQPTQPVQAGQQTEEPVVSPSEPVEVELTAAGIAAAIAASQTDTEGLVELSEDILGGYFASFGLVYWEQAVVLTGQGMDGREITVVQAASESEAMVAALLLEEHRQARVRDFFGYAPEQADMLERAQTLTHGCWVVFLACQDGTAAEAAFAACFEEGAVPVGPAQVGDHEIHTDPTEPTQPTTTPAPTPTPTPAPTPQPSGSGGSSGLDISSFEPYNPPNEVDMTLFDNTAVVNAWRTEDESGLTDMERAILNRCRDAFEQALTEDMTDYEKELALHDWLLSHGEYDAQSRDNVAHIGQPNNTDPYGMLVGGYGICLGFSTTFQLLMDLAGIECITVVGAAYGSTADHAWNMVKLDGEWYCVDVTWDESGEEYSNITYATHKYFNVTSAFLREHDHQWDYLNVPEATATRQKWNGITMVPVG